MDSQKKYLVVIAGPTAVGKTVVSIKLAKLFKTVVLNADSRQFYKELNIGTAKPTNEELKEVEHYFMNTKNVTELYGAGHFANDARNLIHKLFETHEVLILVGGSGLYINALLNGVDEFDEVPINIRENLNVIHEKKGLQVLVEMLLEKDPAYAKSIDIKNPQRVIRALEIITHTGKPFSSYLKSQVQSHSFTSINLLLNMERDALYKRINQRVDDMMQKGLLDEVKNLVEYKNYNALKTVGYKELFAYLDGECTLAEAVDKIKQHTRNYAKRQLTWFNNKGNFNTFHPEDLDGIVRYINLKIQHA
jgi:tRNA dimethylallyltransferase